MGSLKLKVSVLNVKKHARIVRIQRKIALIALMSRIEYF